MNSRQKVVIKAAIKRGVPRVKSPSDSIYQMLGRGISMANKLAARGRGVTQPALSIYTKEEFYGMGRYSRKILDQVQNLRGDKYVIEGIKNSLLSVNERVMFDAARIGKMSAEIMSYQFSYIGTQYRSAKESLDQLG